MHLGEFTEAAEPPCDHGDRCESTLGGENERAVEDTSWGPMCCDLLRIVSLFVYSSTPYI